MMKTTLVAAACLLLLAGSAVADGSTGVLQTSMGAYEFTPSGCAVYKDGDFYDIEIQGPGKAPDGEVFFFELSSTGNHVGVDLGVDGPFKSSDRKLLAGQHMSAEFVIEVLGEAPSWTIVVPELSLIDGNGQHVDAAASLRIEC